MSGAGVTSVPTPSPHELRRGRLLELLHRHSTRPLILLVAPAGFGKSTLAAAYARDSGAATAWLTLQPGDRDSRVFFGRLRLALETAFGGPDRLPNLNRGLAEGAEGVGLARLLLVDLADAPAGFILLLDDFHAVQESDEVRQAVDVLVRGLPEMGQVVLTAREPPALSLTRLVASEAVFALGAEDLRFTPEETAAVRRALGGDATHDAEAEGWVAGILLGGAPRQIGMLGGALLGAYVEREVLARLRPTEQRRLEALAVFDSITVPAAERLLGAGPWSVRLAALAERCPFLLGGRDGSYRLHGLVREALLTRLRRRNAARANRAWAVARELAEESHDMAAQVRACQELGRLDEALALVRLSVVEAQRTGRWGAQLAALELLPDPVRRADPELSLAEAYALLLGGRPDPARQAAEAALQYGGQTDDLVVQARAVLELANISSYAGDLDAADDWLSAVRHLLLRADLPSQLLNSLEGRMYGLRGVCLAVRGRTADARDAFETAERLLELNGPSRELAAVQTNLGNLCSRTGDYEAALSALTRATGYWRLAGDRGTLAAVQTLLGNLHLRTGNFEAAGAALAGAIEAARAVGALRMEAHALASFGTWHRANGRILDAAQQLDASIRLAEEIGEREPLVEALRLRAEVAVVQDDLTTARQLLARAQSEGQRLNSSFQLAGVERALGRLHLAEGSGQRAISYLDAALRRAADAWGPEERIVTLYWLGTAYLHLAQTQQAATILRDILTLAEHAGGVTTLAGPAAEDPRLLRYGLGIRLDPLALAQVERLMLMREPWTGVEPQPVTFTVVVRNELPRIEVRLLGGLTLHRDGELVESGMRGLDRTRELLALLVLHPGGIAVHELTGLLWPDRAPQQAQHNLRMTAYLLRRLLGSKVAVRYAATTYSLASQLELWADVHTFNAALTRARRSTGDAERRALEETVELYRGPLLADVTRDWVESFRLDYQSRYVGAALRLAKLLAVDRREDSDRLAEQIIRVEPDNLEAYERLVSNARTHDDLPGLRRVVQRYVKTVTRLGQEPDPSLLRRASS